MLIIEFCGTPGCGKTTLCDEVEQELCELGYSVRNLQKRKFPATYADKLAVVVERFCFRYTPGNRKLKKALKVLKPYIDEHSLINWSDRILEVAYRARKAERAGVKIGLFDEGCLQFITSVFHEREVADEVQSLVFALVDEMYKERAIVFDCHMDETENYSRLKTRNKTDDRFLIGGRDASLRLLKRKRQNIDKVLDMLKAKNSHMIANVTGFPTTEDVLHAINGARD